MNPEIDTFLHELLDRTVHREVFSAAEVMDIALDLQALLAREPVPA